MRLERRGNAVETFVTFFYLSVTFTRTKREQNATHTREQQKLNLSKFYLFIFAWRTSSLATSLFWRTVTFGSKKRTKIKSNANLFLGMQCCVPAS